MADLSTMFSNALQTIQSRVSGTSEFPLVDVKSNVDGRTYKVRDMPDKQKAADLLASVRMKMEKLYMIVKEKFPNKAQVRQWITNFQPSPERFLEATPDAEHTSYSVNKGEKIHLCLRQRQGQNETLMEENVMVFVALHEMAHVVTPSLGHDPEFWNNFGWLLKQAEANGIYHYQDFKSRPVAYCGMHITDAPAYDPKKDGTDFSLGNN
jgi:hypothetical protein